jgi:hypothetical protein
MLVVGDLQAKKEALTGIFPGQGLSVVAGTGFEPVTSGL